ncbi:methyltransferase [Arthroderma uncinatum]|uniref:methyltransferase n=1 Tax=Arthroderma uncinatum TaxID=74035 RepID=UPI00144A65BB|nr:methyltransferase [Arthroderma uncinatum]KAF3481096.1 methyltransferase [Arthroderma uncinatum]
MSHQATESLYDEIFLDYENNYHNNAGLRAFVREAASKLPPHAQVLDVGCGTGRPIAETLCAAELDVTGIDLSTEMVELCRKRFPTGTFIKADMTKYQPEPQQKFDAIFAVLSLFHVSHRECYSMLFKFSEWLRKDGFLFITTIYSQDLVERGARPDSSGIIDLADVQFMSRNVPLTALSGEKWSNYLTAAGFVDMQATRYDFQPADPTLKVAHHHFITVKKGDSHPLMGPYPYPDKVRGPYSINKAAYKSFLGKLNDAESKALADVLKKNTNVLKIDPTTSNESFLFGPKEKLSYPDNHFDCVVVAWALDGLDNLEEPLREIARVTNSASPNAKIVIIQAAPDNDLLKQVNVVCPGVAEKANNKAPMHHGLILHRAAEALKTNGFANIELTRIADSACRFAERDLAARSQSAANLFAKMYYADEEDVQSMQAVLAPGMDSILKETPNDIGTQAVMLVATPSRAA